MKQQFKFLLVAVFMAGSMAAGAQTAYKDIIHQTYGKVSFDLYCKKGSWGFGQQFFAANFHNNTGYKIHVKGKFVADMVCGNRATSNMDFTCNANSSIIHVSPNDAGYPYSLPKGYGADFSGLVSSADEEACAGNDITAYVKGGTTIKTKNRIKGLGILDLQLFAIQPDGSEVEMNDNGVVINPPAGNNNNTSSNYNSYSNPNGNYNSSSTARAGNANGSTQSGSYNPNISAAQRQNYQNQANYYQQQAQNPNNDPIQTAMYNGLASTSALGAGNTQQMQQIQQQQQQQNQQNMNAVFDAAGSALGTLLNSDILSRHYSIDGQQQKILNRYAKAAEKGDANSQYQIGYYYETGQGGLPQDAEKAAYWYQKAAAQGNTSAQRALRELSK